MVRLSSTQNVDVNQFLCEIAKNVKIVKKGPDIKIAEEGKVMEKALFLLRGTVIMKRG